jgi:hypothetical protein
MLKIVDNKILERCKLCQAENLQYDRQLIPEKMQKDLRLIEIIGKAQRGMEYRYILTLNMGIVRAVLGSGAVSEQINFENLVMEKILSYSAPGFEIMLFQRVSELANKYGLGLADAFHVFYAQGQAEYLITDDDRFLSVWKKDPIVEKETGIIATSSTAFLELCKRYKWL